MPRTVMVLNDDETYTDLHGCSVVQIPDEIEGDETEEFIKDALRENTPSILFKFL